MITGRRCFFPRYLLCAWRRKQTKLKIGMNKTSTQSSVKWCLCTPDVNQFKINKTKNVSQQLFARHFRKNTLPNICDYRVFELISNFAANEKHNVMSDK